MHLFRTCSPRPLRRRVPHGRDWHPEAVRGVRDAAGLTWFNLNGWRHTAITRMAEAGIPIATIMARAGHCSPKMTAHYTHISMQAGPLAMQGMTHSRGPTPRPPERPPQAPSRLNGSGPPGSDPGRAARQVARALHQEREDRCYASEAKQTAAAAGHVSGKGARARISRLRASVFKYAGEG